MSSYRGVKSLNTAVKFLALPVFWCNFPIFLFHYITRLLAASMPNKFVSRLNHDCNDDVDQWPCFTLCYYRKETYLVSNTMYYPEQYTTNKTNDFKITCITITVNK